MAMSSSFLALFAVVIAVVAFQTKAAVIVVTADNNSTIINAVVDDEIIIRLDGNPSTGYRWLQYYLEGNALLQDGEPYYTPSSKAPGSSGKFFFPYRGFDQGPAVVKIVKARTWEGQPLSVFQVSFNVVHKQ